MRTNKTIIFLALSLFLAVAFMPVTAQERPDSSGNRIKDAPIKVTLERPQNDAEKLLSRLKTAQQLMFQGQYIQAADYLENMLIDYPGNPAILDVLTTCYRESKSYDRWLALMQDRIKREEPSFRLYRDMGEAYLAAGQMDSVLHYDIQAALLSEGKEPPLNQLIRPLDRLGYHNQALVLIDTVRTIFNSDDLLSRPRGDALAALGRYGSATYEYLSYMDRDSISAKDGENRLVSMINFEESADTVLAILADEIKNHEQSLRLVTVYGQVLMERGRFDDAFNFFRERDSLRDSQGNEIIQYIGRCNKLGGSGHTIEAGKYFIGKYPNSPALPVARFEMALAYKDLGQYTEAKKQYDLIRSEAIRVSHKAEATLECARLYKDHFNRPDSARILLKKVIREVPGSFFDDQARYTLGDLLISQRQFDSARVVYNTLFDTEFPSSDLAEEAEFLAGKTYVFEGNFKEAENSFKRLVTRYPRGLYINDAIEYIMLIDEIAANAPGQGDLLAGSEFYRHTNRTDSLEYYLTRICKIKIPVLAPLSYLRLAELYLQRADMQRSLAAADSLISGYPESYYRPFGMKLKADILWNDENSRDLAGTIYRQILQDYGTYPFAAEIRKRLSQAENSDRT